MKHSRHEVLLALPNLQSPISEKNPNLKLCDMAQGSTSGHRQYRPQRQQIDDLAYVRERLTLEHVTVASEIDV